MKDGENRFKYLFLSFAASIAGFNYLRRVIVVDGTNLCGKYEGVMLVAARKVVLYKERRCFESHFTS